MQTEHIVRIPTRSLNPRANCLAAYYTLNCRGVLAHLFKTSRQNGDYKLLKCNCYPHFPGVSEHTHSYHRSGMDAGIVNKHMSGKSGSSMREPEYMVPAAPVYGAYSTYPQQPSVYMTAHGYPMTAAPVQYMVPQMPMYSTNTSGMPVNVSNGAVLTEPRGIFISGLDYKTKSKDVEEVIGKYVGRPIEVKLQKDKNGRCKGSATANFSSREEAEYAVAQLNGRQFRGVSHDGKPLSVRYDTEKTVVGQIQSPVIVNGSTTY